MFNGNAEIRESARDKIRGCMIGGAAGDALGYAVEFKSEREIFLKYGEKGITCYDIHDESGKAIISDDTQMSLFTAAGLLNGDTRGALRGIRAEPSRCVAKAYCDWLNTQEMTFEQFRSRRESGEVQVFSWLSEVPELYHRRAPGTTCLTALHSGRTGTVEDRINTSKGCGGIMRVAPMALDYYDADVKAIDKEGAEIAAITHGHSLGFMPAAVLTHIISRIVFSPPEPLENIISEAVGAVCGIFAGDKHLGELTRIIDLAVALSANNEPDLANINRIGEGWVAEETLAISLYCALRHRNDFSAGITAAVNHKGDSDSTGAVTGNILGALLGCSAIEEKWKTDLELRDVILEIADDLCAGCRMSEHGPYEDQAWLQKYVRMKRYNK